MLFFGLFVLTSCADRVADEVAASAPTLQADLPPDADKGDGEICFCLQPPWTFGTSLQVLNGTDKGFDFAIGVSATSQCNMELLNDVQKCTVDHMDYFIGFAQNTGCPVDLGFFDAIEAYDVNGDEVPLELDYVSNGVLLQKPYPEAKVYFRFSEDKPCTPVVDETAFVSGGICIIGIITDPLDPPNTGNGGGNDNGEASGVR
ncbi:MAG: hypothetical protein AAF570_20450 [Bacteroidota bacterium]